MKFSSIVFMLCLLVLVSACGKKIKSGKKYTRITAERIQEIMNNQWMSCGAIGGGTCPDGVARLLTLNPEDADSSSVCSGFMVGPNIMVTNHHCIENQAECLNTHVAVYDGTPSNYLQSKCKRIIKTDQDYASSTDPRRRIDYTVFEIEHNFPGSIFDLAAARAAVSDTVTAWVIDHTGLDDTDGNIYESRVTEFSCTVESTSNTASLMLKNCPVIHGNSGSPAFNSTGDIVGVIWGATDADVSSQTDLVTRRAGPGKAAVTEMIHFAPWI